MNESKKLARLLAARPHPRFPLLGRPALSRRHFFHLAGAGVTASWLAPRAVSQNIVEQASVKTMGTAKHVIAILLTGAPSHIDTFDFKQTADSQLDLLKPETRKGLVWPVGLMPKLGEMIEDFALLRSVRSWNLQHGAAQVWSQIGRSPVAALGDIAPNIGSIVAAEKEAERRKDQVFPGFLSLNAPDGVGSGYLPSAYAPFRVTPAQAGLRNTSSPDDPTGSGRFADRTAVLERLDGDLRQTAAYGAELADAGTFYKSARGMMYNSDVAKAFSFTAAESAEYGNSAFGNACLVARKVLAADQGTHFIQINFGSWDHHSAIYGANNLPRMAGLLDSGLAKLFTDLKKDGLFNETLIVVAGEFGRTVGRLSGAGGRDHFLQQSALIAGAKVKGGRAIGSTNDAGSDIADPGWSRQREIRVEDLEATLYSALGINWTKVRYDDPFGRGFYYVPYSDQDIYGPLNELWG
jgi:hypothetical protein